jgi:hypothetical protein
MLPDRLFLSSFRSGYYFCKAQCGTPHSLLISKKINQTDMLIPEIKMSLHRKGPDRICFKKGFIHDFISGYRCRRQRRET